MNRYWHKSVVAMLAALGLVLSVAATAGTVERERSWGIVMSRDIDARTLEIDGITYQVTTTTTFKDLEGGLIRFEDLEIFDVRKGLFNLKDATIVEFVTRKVKKIWVLDSVHRVAQLPR